MKFKATAIIPVEGGAIMPGTVIESCAPPEGEVKESHLPRMVNNWFTHPKSGEAVRIWEYEGEIVK